jgi:hypothetical protein
MAASVSDVDSLERRSRFAGLAERDVVRGFGDGWNLREVARIGHLILGNQRGIKACVSARCFGGGRSVHVHDSRARCAIAHAKRRAEDFRATFCLNHAPDQLAARRLTLLSAGVVNRRCLRANARNQRQDCNPER